MRKMLYPCILFSGFIVVSGAASVQSGDKAEPKSIIANAIKAIGGKKALKKIRAMKFNDKGTYHGMGAALPYTGKFAIQYPNKFRMEIKDVFTAVYDGKKGWTKMIGGDTTPMEKKALAQQRASQHCMWVGLLVPLAGKAKGYALSGLGEVKVGDIATNGVKVSRKGFPDVSLYFDKKSGLLVKSAYKIPSSEQGFKIVLQEEFLSDYKTFGGVKLATKSLVKQEGKVYIESNVVAYEPAGKLDAKLFAKP